MDVQKITDIESIIDSIDTKSLKQLIGFRNRVTEAFNVIIKEKRELNKKKRDRTYEENKKQWEDAAMNATGSAVSTDVPIVKKKKKQVPSKIFDLISRR